MAPMTSGAVGSALAGAAAGDAPGGAAVPCAGALYCGAGNCGAEGSCAKTVETNASSMAQPSTALGCARAGRIEMSGMPTIMVSPEASIAALAYLSWSSPAGQQTS